MKKLFYVGVLCFLLFEIANVYFIMPMPGSQEVNSIHAAFFLYKWRWWFRIGFGILCLLGAKSAVVSSRWLATLALLILAGVTYATNFKMAADIMFYQPISIQFNDASKNVVANDKLILGVAYNGEAKAYPIQFLGYHHQVRDSIGGKPIMVTYCTVCRTGRVFEPLVKGKPDNFRLVGMDHFNAMFEDYSTKSWWRQATGEAIAGTLKGESLPEFPYTQTTLGKWLELYPNATVLQPDKNFQIQYDSMKTYEKGKLTGRLTRRDTASWQPKSWVVGINVNLESKAYDWNKLLKDRLIHDVIGNQPILVVLSKDNNSFAALERINKEQIFTLNNDTLKNGNICYNMIGIAQSVNTPDLKKVNAYQEYWHSWQTFHPTTKK